MRSKEEIQAEVDLLNYLKANGVNVAYPVRRQNGTFLSEFQTVNGIRYGVMYEAVGVRSFDEVEETADLNERLGSYIASIHQVWDRCDLKIDRKKIDSQLFIDHSMDAIREFTKVHDFDLDFLENVAGKIKEKLYDLPVEQPQYGMCHGDFYGGNIRLNGDNSPVLYDFDFCGIGWRAYDISMYAFPFSMGADANKLSKREVRKDQFLKGYNKVRPMSEKEIQSIALFIPFRRIFNLGTLYITYLQNTWGDAAVFRNIDADIMMLKQWLEINPVL
jgi:Ser/Thr protein kinase RdoA (MazF antagonist)